MAENISEEEKVTQHNLNKKPPSFKKCHKDWDTEIISVKDCNDFDKLYDLKTASDEDSRKIQNNPT